jgi:hypothetical protein
MRCVQHRRQHHKGLKRPRAWHHGRRQGLVNDRKLRQYERAVGQALKVESRVLAASSEIIEHAEVWNALPTSAPFVPRFWPDDRRPWWRRIVP